MDCYVVQNKYASETSTECGVDVNKANSYDQTALDIVNKFTTSRASKEIKQLLKEASFTVQAKAIRDHCNICDPKSLTFKEGDIIKIVEQKQDGVWKGSLMKEGRMAKAGFFPADHVVLIDDNVGRRNAFQNNTKHIVTSHPDTSDLIPQTNGFHGNGRSLSHGSSFGSIGPDDGFPPPPSPICSPKFPQENGIGAKSYEDCFGGDVKVSVSKGGRWQVI